MLQFERFEAKLENSLFRSLYRVSILCHDSKGMPRFMIMYFYTKQNNKTDFRKDLFSESDYPFVRK